MKRIADTSLEAYDYLKTHNLLTPSREKVYKCLLENGPLTGKQIAKKLNKNFNEISGRITELKDLGLVKVIGRVKEEGSKTSSSLLQAVKEIK